MIILGATKIFPSQIEEIIAAEAGLAPQFEVLLDRKDGIDTLSISVEPAEDANGVASPVEPAVLCEHTARKLEAVLGITARVELVQRGALSQSHGGKIRRVVDRRRI